MKKFLRIARKVVVIFLISVVSLYLIAYVYVTVNKKKIIAHLTEEMSRKINGDVKIGEADISFFKSFPKISVLASDILITDSLYKVHKHPFFSAKEIFVSINIIKLIKKQSPLTGLRIRNAGIYLYTDTSGYSNAYMLKSKKDPAGGPKKTSSDINLNKIELDYVRITMEDKQKEKLHDFIVKDLFVNLSDNDNILKMSTEADITVNSLAFNLPRGTFLKNTSFAGDFILKYGKESQQLSFDSIDIKLNGKTYNLTGKFDLADKNPAFSFRVHTRGVKYDEVKKLLPKRIDSSLSMVGLDVPVDADAQLHGPLNGGEPFILAQWKVKDAKLVTPFLDFDHASFTGYFKNEVVAGLPRKDPNSVINVSNFTASWHTIPVKSGNIEILNLAFPELTCDLRSSFPMKSINEILKTNSLVFNDGDVDFQLRYKGPIQKNNNTNSFLNGSFLFRNGIVKYAPRNVEMKDLNGTLVFANSNVDVKDLRCTVLNTKFVMNGSANNLLTLMNTAPSNVAINWNIYTPSLNLGAFTFLLKKRGPAKAASGDSKDLGEVSGSVDDMLEKSRVNLTVKAGSVTYKKLNANNFDADISMLSDRYMINNVSMGFAGGSMKLAGQLVNERDNFHRANVNTSLENVDVTKAFYAFDNFGQTAITSESLEGRLSAKINASMALDDEGTILPSSTAGTVDFSLKDGALNNYEPIKKIQRFVFKKRDFENIRFAELKDHFTLSNGEVQMDRMEIQSSVLTLYVEGKYGTKTGSDISIQVPLNNLRKRDEDYNPINIGTDKKGGRSIFLRGQTGKDGNVDFKLDLFNKYRKEKESATK